MAEENQQNAAKGGNKERSGNWRNGVGQIGSSPTFYYDFQYKGKRYTGSTESEGRRKAETFVADLKRKLQAEAKKDAQCDQAISVETHITDYLKHLKRLERVADYIRQTGVYLRKFVAHYNIKRLDEVTPRNLNDYLVTVYDKKSLGTKKLVIVTLKSFLKWAELENPKRIERSPLYGYAVPTVKPVQRTYDRVRFTEDELTKLCSGVIASRTHKYLQSRPNMNNPEARRVLRKAERDSVLYRFMYETCARTNDAKTLCWNQLRYDDAVGSHVVRFYGKGGTVEDIPMRKELYELLMAEKAAQALFNRKPVLDSARVFIITLYSAEFLRDDCAYLGIRKDKTERDKIDLHCFRGSFATNCALADLHVSKAQLMLRHTNV